MAAPHRGNTGYSCYFITASTFQKQNILQSDRMAGLFVDVLLHYRQKQKYLQHEFVVMPDHFHLLITPLQSLERAMQLIKGGFSFRAKRELGFIHEIWQPSFYDRRVRDAKEYFAFREYIRQNPRKRGLTVKAENYSYSSAWPGLVLDEGTSAAKAGGFHDRLNRSGKPLRHPKALSSLRESWGWVSFAFVSTRKRLPQFSVPAKTGQPAMSLSAAGPLFIMTATSELESSMNSVQIEQKSYEMPPREGISIAQFLTIADIGRSARWYEKVLGARILSLGDGNAPGYLQVANIWMILNVGGGPTPDKPTVTLSVPDPDHINSFMNIRVADIQACYKLWKSRGAEFITEPIPKYGEIRCYMRDPDGYIIEVGQSTDLTYG
jgi:REP element-mobilizing transposase RayT/catechol 2,3-dioxygenase-like lactoylglutathione lyase family enzyme